MKNNPFLRHRRASALTDPARPDAPVRIVATESPERFVLIAHVDVQPHRFEIDARPEVARAATWERSVRSIVNVVLCRSENGWSASATVVGHRRPVRRTISVGTALALGLRGHRISVCSHTLMQNVTGREAVPELAEGVDHGRLPL